MRKTVEGVLIMKCQRTILWISLCIVLLLPLGVAGHADVKGSKDLEATYEVRLERSVMMPMRDGIKLSTDLYFPVGAGEKWPVVQMRTPYNKKGYRREGSMAYLIARLGYIVAVQDMRGRFESQGKYTVSKADVYDGYDCVEWLASQPWSNGKVGSFGCSYLGENQIMMARARPPHLACMIPLAAGGVIPHKGFGLSWGGVNKITAGFGWFIRNGSKVFLHPPADAPDDFWAKYGDYFEPGPIAPDVAFQQMWQTLPIIDMVRAAGYPDTDWEDFVSNGPGSEYWIDRGYVVETDKFDTPALHVNTWYDECTPETFYEFNIMRRNAVSDRGRNHQYVIIGPQAHCDFATNMSEDTYIGDMSVGDTRFDYFGLFKRWLAYWLKGIDNAVTSTPKVQYFLMGKNEWRSADEWPLAKTQFTKYYLHSDGQANSRYGTGALSTQTPGNEKPDTYTYDPGSPVPTLGGPVCCTGTPDAAPGAYDQSEIEMRHDVLVYSTPVLKESIEVTGPIELVLYVSSSAKDTDFTGKLVDVYPDGTAFNICEGILRARYREAWNREVFMERGQVYTLTIDVSVTSIYFQKGHRIRLEVASSNFPRFDRNLNTGGNNYDESEWLAAKNTIHHSKKHPSHLILPIIR